MTTTTQINKAIRAGIEFKKAEKMAGGVTSDTIEAYKFFNKIVNGLSDEQKSFINSEVRRLNK